MPSYAKIDDLSPKRVKEAIVEQCLELGDGRHELRALLRRVLDRIFADSATRRPRVGPNRHWPRLLQYVREIEEETDWEHGQGIRLSNLGGGGKVARNPSDPANLAIKVDSAFL